MLLAFLGFSDSLLRVLLVLTGLLLVVVSFRGRRVIKPADELSGPVVPQTMRQPENK